MFSVLELRTNVTEQKERIIIKNLISYKLKYQAKEARLILQSGIQIFCYLLLCTLFVHFFCTYVRVRTQLQILRSFLCLRTIAKPVANFAKFGKIVTYDFSQFFVMLMSVTQVEPSCGVFQICENRKVDNFSQSLVVRPCAMSQCKPASCYKLDSQFQVSTQYYSTKLLSLGYLCEFLHKSF